ncbi:MAG: hypothetical protein N3B16_01835 [Candidatus Aminicenantes bacterium]|nr:hypothetical protein [Candidatus Aminicenantes bacterium]
MTQFAIEKLEEQINKFIWYHTIDLGNGLITPGLYDHRPYLKFYGFPEDLKGKRVLDIGTLNGFFAFEFERRGAKVVATELPDWLDHDFGPDYKIDRPLEVLKSYLHESFELAKKILNSKVEKILTNIYEISPEKLGYFDLVFCGSLLLHLTDPIKALWNIKKITQEIAIIATAIQPEEDPIPQALYIGHSSADTWWLPNKACLIEMIKSAGFSRVEWFSKFRLDYRNGQPGWFHGVVHAKI